LQEIKEKEVQPEESYERKIQSSEECVTKKKQSQHKSKPGFKRALVDPRPLYLPDGVLTSTLKDLVGQIHGDFGRASVATGLRTIYSNAETRLCMIQTRHGPHRLIASSLPFLTKIKNEKIVPRLIYTGATVRNCYQKMLQYQKEQLNVALRELGNHSKEREIDKSQISCDQISKSDTENSIEVYTKNTILQELEKKLMNIRTIGANNKF
jgi:ribonuclease P/MRP protein subunit POP5